jgi:hypothetical protein
VTPRYLPRDALDPTALGRVAGTATNVEALPQHRGKASNNAQASPHASPI